MSSTNVDQFGAFTPDLKGDSIKEKLNLHVKRRLQQEPPSSTESTVSSAPCSPPKKPKPPTPGTPSAATSSTPSGASKKTKTKRPSSSGEEKIPPEVGRKRQEEKISSTVEILQMILNEKKNSLLKDPEVIAFLQAIHKTTPPPVTTVQPKLSPQ
ncbi:hypothetical protein DMENIID0001_054410 [Sergentomyia squamirostris]